MIELRFTEIIFLVSRFPPYVGGVPARAYRIAEGLSQRGHKITVYTSTHPQAPCFERINGIKVERHNLFTPFTVRLDKTSQVILGLYKLLSNKEIQEADIVQSFHFMSPVSLAAASLKLARKKVFALCPLLFPIFHWIDPIHLVRSQWDWSMKLYRLTLGNMIIKSADLLIPETNFEKNSLIQLGVPNNKIKVVPDAINTDHYKQLPDSMIFRKKHNIDASERIVLFVGIPSFVKGLHHLIMAMHNVLEKMREAKLVTVGPNMTRIKRLLRDFGSPNVRDRTVITGSLTGKTLLSAYSAADAFVLLSKFETFGMVMLEAAASGLPIVCTRVGVAPDIVINGKNGLFVKYGKVDQISDAIIRVLMDDNFKREAEKRRYLIWKNYDHKKEIDQYEKAYLRLIR